MVCLHLIQNMVDFSFLAGWMVRFCQYCAFFVENIAMIGKMFTILVKEWRRQECAADQNRNGDAGECCQRRNGHSQFGIDNGNKCLYNGNTVDVDGRRQQ